MVFSCGKFDFSVKLHAMRRGKKEEEKKVDCTGNDDAALWKSSYFAKKEESNGER